MRVFTVDGMVAPARAPRSPLSPSLVPLAPVAPRPGTAVASSWELRRLAQARPPAMAAYWLGFTLRSLRVLSGDEVLFDVAERHLAHAAQFAAVTGAHAERRVTRRAQRMEVRWRDPALVEWLQSWQSPSPPRATRRGPHRARPLDGTQNAGLDVPVQVFTDLGPTARRAFVRGLLEASGSVLQPVGHGAQIVLYGPMAVMEAVQAHLADLWAEAPWPSVRAHPTTRDGRGVSLAITGPARLRWFRAWVYEGADYWWEPQRLACMTLLLPMPEESKRRGKSAYRGVAWSTSRAQWRVRLLVNGITYDGGTFVEEAEAARAYDALRVTHGRSPINFPR